MRTIHIVIARDRLLYLFGSRFIVVHFIPKLHIALHHLFLHTRHRSHVSVFITHPLKVSSGIRCLVIFRRVRNVRVQFTILIIRTVEIALTLAVKGSAIAQATGGRVVHEIIKLLKEVFQALQHSQL